MGLSLTRALIPVLFLIACGPEPESETAAAEPEAAVEDSATAAPRPPPPLRVVQGPIRFQHPAHGEISCSRCHAGVPGHARHEQVACGECHEMPTPVADLARMAGQECDACHHGATQSRACLDCHEAAPVEARRLTVALRIAGRDSARVRRLPFDHERHAQLECAACHRAEPAVATPQPCQACHTDHHRPGTRCLTCHEAVPPDAHDREAHRGCTGAGCHAGAALMGTGTGRQVCLVCHARQETHEPGEECSRCHLLRDAPDARGSGS